MVHRARWVRERSGPRGRRMGYLFTAQVVCNRVPDWHAFKVVDMESVTCPECIRRIGRTGNHSGLPYIREVVVAN